MLKTCHQARSGQIWVNFGQKGQFLNFPKKCENVIFFRLQRLGLVQQARVAMVRRTMRMYKDQDMRD